MVIRKAACSFINRNPTSSAQTPLSDRQTPIMWFAPKVRAYEVITDHSADVRDHPGRPVNKADKLEITKALQRLPGFATITQNRRKSVGAVFKIHDTTSDDDENHMAFSFDPRLSEGGRTEPLEIDLVFEWATTGKLVNERETRKPFEHEPEAACAVKALKLLKVEDSPQKGLDYFSNCCQTLQPIPGLQSLWLCLHRGRKAGEPGFVEASRAATAERASHCEKCHCFGAFI